MKISIFNGLVRIFAFDLLIYSIIIWSCSSQLGLAGSDIKDQCVYFFDEKTDSLQD